MKERLAPLWRSFMEAGSPRVNKHELSDSPKDPGAQGPGTQKYCRCQGYSRSVGLVAEGGILVFPVFGEDFVGLSPS